MDGLLYNTKNRIGGSNGEWRVDKPIYFKNTIDKFTIYDDCPIIIRNPFNEDDRIHRSFCRAKGNNPLLLFGVQTQLAKHSLNNLKCEWLYTFLIKPTNKGFNSRLADYQFVTLH